MPQPHGEQRRLRCPNYSKRSPYWSTACLAKALWRKGKLSPGNGSAAVLGSTLRGDAPAVSPQADGPSQCRGKGIRGLE